MGSHVRPRLHAFPSFCVFGSQFTFASTCINACLCECVCIVLRHVMYAQVSHPSRVLAHLYLRFPHACGCLRVLSLNEAVVRIPFPLLSSRCLLSHGSWFANA